MTLQNISWVLSSTLNKHVTSLLNQVPVEQAGKVERPTKSPSSETADQLSPSKPVRRRDRPSHRARQRGGATANEVGLPIIKLRGASQRDGATDQISTKQSSEAEQLTKTPSPRQTSQPGRAAGQDSVEQANKRPIKSLARQAADDTNPRCICLLSIRLTNKSFSFQQRVNASAERAWWGERMHTYRPWKELVLLRLHYWGSVRHVTQPCEFFLFRSWYEIRWTTQPNSPFGYMGTVFWNYFIQIVSLIYIRFDLLK